jgi:hypothetical protein
LQYFSKFEETLRDQLPPKNKPALRNEAVFRIHNLGIGRNAQLKDINSKITKIKLIAKNF